MATRKQWAMARINPQGNKGIFGVDKRVKLTEAHKAEIRRLHAKGTPQREIARIFDGICSRRAIQFVLFPERLAIVKAQYKERRKDGRYYDKDKWRETQRKHRARLREVNPELANNPRAVSRTAKILKTTRGEKNYHAEL